MLTLGPGPKLMERPSEAGLGLGGALGRRRARLDRGEDDWAGAVRIWPS